MISLIVILLVVLVVIALIASCAKIVPEANVYVVERLGKYNKSLNAGLHFIIPVIDRVARKVSIKEQVADFPPQAVITKDNVTMEIDSVVYFKVFDPRSATYGITDAILGLENLCATTLRNICGDMTLDECLTSREKINAQMVKVVDEATDAWGLRVSRVEVRSLQPQSETIRRAMEKQMTAEREKRQTILEAEGHKQAVITRKEGDKQAVILDAEAKKEAQIAAAEAEARSIELVYEAQARGLQMLLDTVGKDGMMMLKQLESLEKVADGNATKLIVPTELTASASGFVNAATLLKSGFEADAVKPKKATLAKEDPCCDEDQRHEVDDIDTLNA